MFPQLQRWTAFQEQNMQLSQSLCRECCRNYYQLAGLIQRSKLTSVMKKFSQPKYHEATQLICESINRKAEKPKQMPISNLPESCDKSTRGGSSAKQGIISTPSQFNSAGKQFNSKSAVLH